MKLYQISALKKLLNDLKTQPRKSLSQNFLIDGNIVRKIVQAAEISPGEHILEVGPGPGVLTEALLEENASVVAIEKDDGLSAALENWKHPALTVIHKDFLKVDLEEILEPQTKVVANIPYSITGILLQRLLPLGHLINSLTLMVQREVADRLLAKVGSSSYSSFTLFTRFYSDVKLLFPVSASCFYPKPNVESAVIQIKLRNAPQKDYPSTVIRQAFQQRRKMLRASLKPLFSPTQVETALETLGFNPTARPQELSLEAFQKLSHLLSESTL